MSRRSGDDDFLGQAQECSSIVSLVGDGLQLSTELPYAAYAAPAPKERMARLQQTAAATKSP
jgi:hypothetical protein